MRYFYSLLLFCLPGFLSAQNGLNFDGVDDYVGSNYPGIAGNAERTVEAWINTTENAIGNQQVIVDMGTMATGTRFTFCVLQNNSIRCEIGGNGIVGTTAVNDGNWHHVAATFDPSATNNLKLYIDGVLETQGNFTLPVNTSAAGSVEVGRRNDLVNHFTGTIDEVRVWDVARSQAEIQAAMNAEMCNTNANMRLYYRFNEGMANSNNLGVNQVTDDSGNGYVGTLNNFTLSGNISNWVPGVSLGLGLTSSTVSLDVCDSYTWPVNGQTYTNTGFYSEVLTGSGGCDSTVILDLTVFSPNDLTTNQTACDSFTWGVNGQTYTSSTTVVEALATSQGCQYMHTLNLIVNNSFDTVVLAYDCPPYVWGVNGVSYDSSGTYYAQFTNGQGCDSNYQLNLVIHADAVADITQNSDGSLSTSWTFDVQWVNCATNTAIAGATGMNFMPPADGEYSVIASGPNWCPDTADCYTVDYLDLNSLGYINSGIRIEPNPTNGYFVVTLSQVHGIVEVELVDAQGKVVQEQIISSENPVEMKLEGEPGVYFLRALTDFGWVTERIVKI